MIYSRCVAVFWGITAVLVGGYSQAALAEPEATPWWDDFPVLVQTTDAAKAARQRASAALCGGADNPGWGLFAQHLAIASARETVKALRAADVHPLAWFEGFGTTQTYVAQLKRDSDGMAAGQRGSNPCFFYPLVVGTI